MAGGWLVVSGWWWAAGFNGKKRHGTLDWRTPPTTNHQPPTPGIHWTRRNGGPDRVTPVGSRLSPNSVRASGGSDGVAGLTRGHGVRVAGRAGVALRRGFHDGDRNRRR